MLTNQNLGVIKSLFSGRIMEVEAPPKYSTTKLKKYGGDIDLCEYVCHFEQKRQTISVSMQKLNAMKCKTFIKGLARPTLLWLHQLLS